MWMPTLAAAAVLLALERVTYALVCRRSDEFLALCRERGVADPVRLLQQSFYGFKGIQLAVFGAWCGWFGAATGWPANWLEPAGWLGLACIAAGQALNASVFLRLGRVGVFYGDRLGRDVAWRDEFPYSLFDHPQYVGAVLSIWGLFLLLRHPFEDWIALPLLETAYYAAGAWLERAPRPLPAGDGEASAR